MIVRLGSIFIALGVAVLSAAEPEECTSSRFAAPLPVGPRIARPAPLSLLHALGPGDANNLHEVAMDLDFTPLAPHVASEAHAACLRLLVVVDGYQRFHFAWPWPPASQLLMRLGTHVLEVSLESRGEDGAWAALTPVSSSAFDVVPSAASPPAPAFSAGIHAHDQDAGRQQAELLPAGLAFDCPRETRPSSSAAGPLTVVRVALVGSLHLAGQNLLALEQGRRLPDLCVATSQGGGSGSGEGEGLGATTFDVAYLSVDTTGGLGAPGPLAALLAEARVPLRRYAVELQPPAVEALRHHRRGYGKIVDAGGSGGFDDDGSNDGGGVDGDGNGDAFGTSEASVVGALVAALAEARDWGALDPALQLAVAPLASALEGVHVLSFTNHETMVRVSAAATLALASVRMVCPVR